MELKLRGTDTIILLHLMATNILFDRHMAKTVWERLDDDEQERILDLYESALKQLN